MRDFRFSRRRRFKSRVMRIFVFQNSGILQQHYTTLRIFMMSLYKISHS